jgi:site-specific recombinase XerD
MQGLNNQIGKSTNAWRQRGVYERIPGSGEWWIRYADESGRIRREKAGTKRAAVDIYRKRKTEILQGKKLPETLRTRVIRFSELAADARKYVEDHNRGKQIDLHRISHLEEAFGDRAAEIPIEDLREWFTSHNWSAGTWNRYKSVLSRIYRLGIENNKITTNPTRLLKRMKEADGRVRFLNQHDPKEEARLRKIIALRYPIKLPEFEIALNTGMRRSEQYPYISWACVDFQRRDLFVPESKSGKSRHIPLNTPAFSAFQALHEATGGQDPIFASRIGGESLRGPRHWFEGAIAEARLNDFTWHDLRHTFASRLVMTGTDLRTVAELMGHRTIQMTMRYAHLAPEHKQAAVDRLASFSARSRKKSTDTKTSTKQKVKVRVVKLKY